MGNVPVPMNFVSQYPVEMDRGYQWLESLVYVLKILDVFSFHVLLWTLLLKICPLLSLYILESFSVFHVKVLEIFVQSVILLHFAFDINMIRKWFPNQSLVLGAVGIRMPLIYFL